MQNIFITVLQVCTMNDTLSIETITIYCFEAKEESLSSTQLRRNWENGKKSALSFAYRKFLSVVAKLTYVVSSLDLAIFGFPGKCPVNFLIRS